MLLGGATDFFHGLTHQRQQEADAQGLASERFGVDWSTEGKDVWMFSGCADDQTSADTSIAGSATGAMSWAFIGSMRENPQQSYVEARWSHPSTRLSFLPASFPLADHRGTTNSSCRTHAAT